MQKTSDLAANIQALEHRFIFGTQYYRPPTPLPEEWERDLDTVAELGMDHIRLWALWCFCEPRPGEYQFAPYDRLIDLAAERDIGVCINFIFDHVPVWAARKHNGFLRGADGSPARTELLFGGHFACWDNPALRGEAERFIRAAAQRYRDNPHLVLWDVWNEVKYYRCWCPHSARAFANYLLKRFGSLDAVNKHCATCYGDTDEIELPRPGARDLCLDLVAGEFQREQLNRQMRWVRDVIRSVDALTPIMTHSHSWGSVTNGLPMWDDWTVRKQVDLWGASQHILYYQNHHAARNRFAFTVANLESKRASGRYWLSEISTGIVRGGIGGMRMRVNEGELTFNLWTFLAHGAKGFTFWQLHPERYSAEAPGWGLVAMDGSETFHSAEARAFKRVLDQHRQFLERSAPPAERVGVFYDPQSSILHTLMKRSDYTRIFHGIVYALWMHAIHFRILREWDTWDDFDTIFFPGTVIGSDALLEKVLAFVQAGGTAVVEAGFGSYAPNGMYRTVVPGDKLHETFGYREKDILPLFDKDVSVELETTGLRLTDLPTRINMQIGEHSLLGSYDYRRVEPEADCAVIGTYPDGSPAVLRRDLGNGRLFYFGSVLGTDLLESDDPRRGAKLLDILGLESEVPFTAAGPVTARTLSTDTETWRLFFNHGNDPASVQWQGASLEPVFESAATWPDFTIEGKGVKVLTERKKA